MSSEAHARIARLERELQDAHRRIEELTAELERVRDSRDDFLAAMNHELRTPLNHIIGFADMLALGMAGVLDEEQQRQIAVVRDSGRYLFSIIEDVLDLSRLDAGAARFSEDDFSAAEVVEAAVELKQPIAVEKGLAIVQDVPASELRIRSDRRRVRQILGILIGNALKFTREGHVLIRVSRDDGVARFEVSDTGMGIPPDKIEAVFEEFVQLPVPGIAKSSGMGLGLTLGRKLARLLGGDISVTSTSGAGSTFTLTLPIDRSSDRQRFTW